MFKVRTNDQAGSKHLIVDPVTFFESKSVCLTPQPGSILQSFGIHDIKKITESSAEHDVFTCTLRSVDGPELSRVMKFHKRTTDDEERTCVFTRAHAAAVNANYDRMKTFLAKHPSRFNVSVSNVQIGICNVDGTEYTLWFEDYLSGYRKFVGNKLHPRSSLMAGPPAVDVHACLVSSTESTLTDLQVMMYLYSNGKYTVVDLQGAIVDGKYVLCDIEYTDTLSRIRTSDKSDYLRLFRCHVLGESESVAVEMTQEKQEGEKLMMEHVCLVADNPTKVKEILERYHVKAGVALAGYILAIMPF